MSAFKEHRDALKEIRDGSLAFFREARNGSANVDQANVGARMATKVTSSIGMDLRVVAAERAMAK